MDRETIINKIRKLLRLSGSDNVHEAAAAAARAQELLAKYNLALADIAPDDDSIKAAKSHKKTRQRLENWAYSLAHNIADAFDCKYYHTCSSGVTTFVGIDPAPEICGWLYHYLYKTLLKLASAHMNGPAKRLRSPKSKRIARASFLFGAVGTIRDRLVKQKQETPITPAGLVPLTQSIIQAAMPDLKTGSKLSIDNLRFTDWAAGCQAAAGIPLSKPLREGSAPAALS